MEDEVQPVRKTPSFSISIGRKRNSEQLNSSGRGNSSRILSQGEEKEQTLIKRELLGDIVPLLPRNSGPGSSFQDEDCITLSSDEEVDVELAERNEDLVMVPGVKIEEEMESEGEPEIIELLPEENEGDEEVEELPKRKSRRRKLPPKRLSLDYFLQQKQQQSKRGQGTSGLQNICQYCGRKMASMKVLMEHIQKQHIPSKPGVQRGELKYKCSTCGKGMNSEHSLNIHQGTHSEERPFSCNLCKTKYKSQFYLDNHLKTKGHKNVEAMQEYILGGEIPRRNNGCPSPPLLPVETTRARGPRNVISTTGASLGRKFPAKKPKPVAVVPLANTGFPEAPVFSQQNGIMPSMMAPMQMQGGANPVLFYGYMMNPNGGQGNAFPAIQPTSFVSHSGMPGMVPQQNMQQMFLPIKAPGGHHHQSGSVTLFTCSECQAQFSVEAHLRSHMKEEHSKDCWKCPKCSEVMLNPTEFGKHYSQCGK